MSAMSAMSPIDAPLRAALGAALASLQRPLARYAGQP
jgi:hypothetical protein